MASIFIFAVCGLMVAFSFGKAPDSREHAPSEEEKLASYGMSWGAPEDLADQLALAQELRAALKEYQAARSAGREPAHLPETRDWADRLAA